MDCHSFLAILFAWIVGGRTLKEHSKQALGVAAKDVVAGLIRAPGEEGGTGAIALTVPG
jgi:hypothetical protein